MANPAQGQQTYWERWAASYDHRYGYDTCRGQEKVLEKALVLVEVGKISLESRVLELGCGTGAFTREIAKTAKCVAAVDVSERMLGIAENSTSKEIGNIRYRRCDFHYLSGALGTALGSFDCVVAAYSLMYADVDKACWECYQMLRPGGRLAILEINGLNPVVALKVSWVGKRWLGVSREAHAHPALWWKCKLAGLFTNAEVTYISSWQRFLAGSMVIGATKP